MSSTFQGVLAGKKKKHLFILWYRAEKQEMFEECLRENKFVKNLEVFWRSNKTNA